MTAQAAGRRVDPDLRGRQAAGRPRASRRWCAGTRSRCSSTADGQVYAIGNHDPFSRVGMLGRGIVGTRGDVPFVASTDARQAFDLRTGRCLDDAVGQRADLRRADRRRGRARRAAGPP